MKTLFCSLNIQAHDLKYSYRHPDHSAIALYHTTERFGASGVKEITFGQLKERVREVAAALKRLMIMIKVMVTMTMMMMMVLKMMVTMTMTMMITFGQL